jgi:hypothetical protein
MRAASRSRRRTRLRATALPTLRLAVIPSRIPAVGCCMLFRSSGRNTCKISPGVAHARPSRATRTNSDRRFSRGTAGGTNRSGGKALAPPPAPSRQHATTADRRHAPTESMSPLANELARLICPLHEQSPTRKGHGVYGLDPTSQRGCNLTPERGTEWQERTARIGVGADDGLDCGEEIGPQSERKPPITLRKALLSGATSGSDSQIAGRWPART